MGMIPKQAIDTSGRAEKSLIERERERWIASAQAAYAKAKEDRDLYLERLKMEEVLKKPKGGKFYPDPKITADREDPFAIFRKMEAGQLIPEFSRSSQGSSGMMPGQDASYAAEFYRKKRESLSHLNRPN